MVDLYGRGFSIAEISCALFLGRQKVWNILRRRGIMRENHKANYFDFSKKKLEILDGLMLGDGYLHPWKNKKTREVISAFYEHSSSLKAKKFIVGLKDFLEKYWDLDEIKITDKKIHFKLCSPSFRNFKEQYFRWYSNGKKIVPKDIRLTPIVCLLWFLGDGSVADTGRLISTDGYTKREVEFLQRKFFEVGIRPTLRKPSGNHGWRIYIPAEETKKFLNYIGPCPQWAKYYKYKWENKRRKKNVEERRTQ